MRYFSLAVFLTLVMGFAGCGDMGGTGGEAADDGAMEEMPMDEGSAGGSARMDPGGPPQWQVLQQNVVHNE